MDESFVDFADCEQGSILSQEILRAYPGLIVVKSISKSFGVPGLRLGILAAEDRELITMLKKNVAIWNINSFGEFYMQIAEKYRSDYDQALNRFCAVRDEFANGLKQIAGLTCYPDQANYLMCRLDGTMTAAELTERLLCDYNILIKDLSTKKGLDGEYIRLAVRRPEENDCLLAAMKELLTERGKGKWN